MRARWGVLAVGVGCVFAVAALAQTASREERVFGTMNPRTGVFRPLHTGTVSPVIVPTTGTVNVSVNGTISPGLPTPSQIFCVVHITISSTTGDPFYQDKTQTNQAEISGSTFTCKLEIGYSARVDVQAGAPMLSISFAVTAIDTAYPGALDQGLYPSRRWTSDTENFVTIALPADSVTTTETFSLDF